MEQSLQLLGNLANEFHCMDESNNDFSSFETSFQKKTQSELQESNDDISSFEEKKTQESNDDTSSFETSFQKRTQRNLDFGKKNDFSAERNGDYLRFEYINLCKEYNDLKKLKEPPLPCKRRMKKCPPLRKLPKKQDVQDKSDEADKSHVDVKEEHVEEEHVEEEHVEEEHVEEEHVEEEHVEEEHVEEVHVEEEHVEEVHVEEEHVEEEHVDEVHVEQLPEEKKNKKNPYSEWLPSQRIPKRNIIAQPEFPNVKTCSSENLLNFIKASERSNVRAKTDLIINALQKGKSIEVIFYYFF
jgi:hypothetical protein